MMEGHKREGVYSIEDSQVEQTVPRTWTVGPRHWVHSTESFEEEGKEVRTAPESQQWLSGGREAILQRGFELRWLLWGWREVQRH